MSSFGYGSRRREGVARRARRSGRRLRQKGWRERRGVLVDVLQISCLCFESAELRTARAARRARVPRACHSSLFVLWGEGGGTGLQWRLPLLHGGWLQVSALLAHGSCSKRDGLFVGARARARARYFVVSTRARVQGSYCPGGGPIYACASGSTTTSTGATSSAACVRASLPPGSYAERCVPFRLPS